ncbi:hypothetical protein GCM10028805_51320 [Spirosoma harenae]
MKALVRLLLLVIVIGGIVLYFVSQRNHTSFSPSTIDLSVDCSDVENVLVTSTVDVVVENFSSRSHKDISVKLIAYNKDGEVIKEKFTTFSRTLAPKGRFDKPVTLPADTKRCDCKVVSSHPE